MTFEDFFQGLDEETQKSMRIEEYHPFEYLYGDIAKNNADKRIFTSLPLDIHFAVKHFNKGKIESHLWYFKGFCQLLNPTYCHIIDTGTIATSNSLSKITLLMDSNKKIGGA